MLRAVSRRTPPTRHTFRPKLEALEDREVLSAAVTEFTLPSNASYPRYMTVGPDHNIWYTASGGIIGMMDLTGHVQAVYKVPSGSGTYLNEITTGSDGNLWFAEGNYHQIGRLNPTTGEIDEFRTPANFLNDPFDIISGPDGNLWFTGPDGGTDAIGRVIPGDAPTIQEFATPTSGAGPGGIAVGPDGRMWFTENNGGSQIGRVTTAGSILEYKQGITQSSLPTDIAAGSDGNLWFTERNAAQIGRITTAGVVTEFSTGILQRAFPNSIAAGPDGALWFTEPGTDQIGRITTSGKVTQFTVPSYEPNLLKIMAGPDGNLWFTESTAGKIARVNVQLVTAGANVQPTQGKPFTGVVATFNGGAFPLTAASYAATITWGDGHTSAGTIVDNGNGAYSVQGTNTYASVGPANITVKVSDTMGRKATAFSTAHVVPQQRLVVTGADAGGGPDIRLYDALTGQLVHEFMAYNPGFTGGVRVALADLNGDGVPEVITGPGPGGGPDIRVFNQAGGLVGEFLVYAPGFTGGMFVATGDVNGDGVPDIVCTPDRTGGPDVRIFNGRTLAMTGEIMAYDPAFTGGIRVAVGDVNGDGRADVITAPGTGGGPDVRVFSGKGLGMIREFMAYNPAFTGGIYVAAGDVNGDGKADVITGAGATGGPHVQVFSGANTSVVLKSFFAYDKGFTGGVRVAALDVNGDGKADIVTVPGTGGSPDVRVFDGSSLAKLDEFFAYGANFSGGVFVGGA